MPDAGFMGQTTGSGKGPTHESTVCAHHPNHESVLDAPRQPTNLARSVQVASGESVLQAFSLPTCVFDLFEAFMNRHLSIAWLSLGCLIAAACGGDDPTTPPAADTGEDTDAAETDDTVIPDAVVEPDLETPDTVDTDVPEADTTDTSAADAEVDVPLQECDDDERRVGRRCFGPFDRI